jgi:hypothetical protein
MKKNSLVLLVGVLAFLWLLVGCAGPMKISPEQLTKMVNESLDVSAGTGAIKQLHDKNYPDAKGDIEYDVTIDKNGTVLTVFVVNSTLSDPKFQSSLLTVVKAHKLDIRIKDRFKVRHKFTF